MIVNETKEKLLKLKFKGMLTGFEEQLQNTDINNLSFEDRFAMLVDRELLDKENQRLKSRLKQAKLKQSAMIEDIDFRSARGIDQSMILSLASCEWVHKKQNILITGPTGVGKSYIASALAQRACREGFTVAYYRIVRLFEELVLARAAGTYVKQLEKLRKRNVLVLDDWGLSGLNDIQRKDFLEILEDRYTLSSTIIVSQIPEERWYELIGDATIADALLDRLMHNSHRIKMKGGSMRKTHSNISEIKSEI